MSNPENTLVIPDEVILSKIYFIRELKIMIDSDLAELFDVRAIRLRGQEKRNIEKFPVHFMFRLTSEEVESWYRKMRYLPNNILAVLCATRLSEAVTNGRVANDGKIQVLFYQHFIVFLY